MRCTFDLRNLSVTQWEGREQCLQMSKREGDARTGVAGQMNKLLMFSTSHFSEILENLGIE